LAYSLSRANVYKRSNVIPGISLIHRKGHYDDIILWSWYGVKLHYEQLFYPITLQLDVVWLVVMVIAFVSRFWHLEEPHHVV